MAIEKTRLARRNWSRPSVHIEVITDNGFCITRACELKVSGSDSASECHFIVGISSAGIRSVIVKFTEAAIAMAQQQRQSLAPLSLTNSFWLHCAERHLAKYVWENNECPPDGLLTIDSLTPRDLLSASHWD